MDPCVLFRISMQTSRKVDPITLLPAFATITDKAFAHFQMVETTEGKIMPPAHTSWKNPLSESELHNRKLNLGHQTGDETLSKTLTDLNQKALVVVCRGTHPGRGDPPVTT